MTTPPPDGPGALAGLRVVELCDEKGALAGKLFADMGAEVIKVEPLAGDPTRSYPPFLDDEPGLERSLYFWHYNTSKLGVTLDLEQEAGRDLLRRLVASAGVFIESERPGRLAEIGLDYADLRPLNESLIMVSITPFGRTGPRAEEEVTDLTLLAGGGPVWSCGYDDHSLPPVRGGGNQGYHTGCHFAFMSALAALLYRDHTGTGQHIDVNMHAAVNVTTEAATYEYLVAGATVQRQTGRHHSVTPMPSMRSQVRCADGRYVNGGIPARRPEQFRRVHEWLVELDLVDEFLEAPLLVIGAQRESFDMQLISEDEEARAIFAAAREAVNFLAAHLPADEFFRGAQERGFQVGVIYSPEEVIEDPHFIDRGFPVQVEHPELGRTFTYPGAPYKFGASPWRIARRAPLLGEDNESVYGSIVVSAEELAHFKSTGVV